MFIAALKYVNRTLISKLWSILGTFAKFDNADSTHDKSCTIDFIWKMWFIIYRTTTLHYSAVVYC